MNPPERNERQTPQITHLQPLRRITMGGHLKIPHVFKLLRELIHYYLLMKSLEKTAYYANTINMMDHSFTVLLVELVWMSPFCRSFPWISKAIEVGRA